MTIIMVNHGFTTAPCKNQTVAAKHHIDAACKSLECDPIKYKLSSINSLDAAIELLKDAREIVEDNEVYDGDE